MRRGPKRVVGGVMMSLALPLSAQSRPVVAVFAHPDDERVIGPLLSRLAREGRETHLVIATDGGLASFDALGKLRASLVAIIDSLRPAAIITFGPEGGTGHPDHRLVGDVVTQIVQSDAAIRQPGSAECVTANGSACPPRHRHNPQ